MFTAFFFTGCEEEGRIDHIDPNAPAPAQVTNVEVRNTYGGAVLRYTLPNDKNLLSVKAVYEIRPGVQRSTESSYFKDSLILEGFGESRVYDVRLYSIGKNEKMSEPVPVQVEPETPPVRLATTSMRETFGGVAIDFENPERVALAVVLMADTANIGYMSELFTFYTSMQHTTLSFRGLNAVETNFAVYLRDRWDNLSETETATLTPWFEEVIPKPWTERFLEGDAPPVNANYPVSRIWNGVLGPSGGDNYHSQENLLLPQMFTWDFGVTVKLSRFTLWPRNHVNGDDRWTRGHPKEFELYGSLAPNPSGLLDNSWIPLGKFECVKPSGPGLIITQEDIEYAQAGIEFDFVASDFAPDPFVNVRYIRFRTLSTYRNISVSPVSIQEISFWGTIQ